MKNYHLIRSSSIADDTYQYFLDYLREYPLMNNIRIIPHTYTCPPMCFRPENEVSLAEELDSLYPEFQLRIWAKTPEDYCMFYRAQHAIPEEEGILLLSGEEYGMEVWVFGSFYETVPHFFLHTDMWTAFDKTGDQYPLGFQIAAVYLAEALRNPGQIRCL